MTKKKAEVHIENCSITNSPESLEQTQRRVEAVIKLAEAVIAAAQALKGPDTYGVYINR
jgi:hypothetical protein